MHRQSPALVIMAAGMGSRFGGLKQMEPVDTEGHSIIDFSMYDAYRAGFRDLVFIIKREHDALFRERIGSRMERFFHVSYVYQELTDIPDGCAVPEGRVKPWGTGQAVACCRNVLHGPFAVINSDDYYGRTAFQEIYDFLSGNDDPHRYAMVGYRVKNTVTKFGSVARGVCEVQNGLLTGVTERTKIVQREDEIAFTEDGEHYTAPARRHHRLHEPLGLHGADGHRTLEPDARVLPDGRRAEPAEKRVLSASGRQPAAAGGRGQRKGPAVRGGLARRDLPRGSAVCQGGHLRAQGCGRL